MNKLYKNVIFKYIRVAALYFQYFTKSNSCDFFSGMHASFNLAELNALKLKKYIFYRIIKFTI